MQLFVVQSGWILVLLAFTAAYGATLFWARLQNRLGRLARAVLVMNIAVWPLAIVGTIIVPEALPITSLSGLGPVLLAVPEMSRRAVARLLSLSVVMTLAITAISTVDITHLGDRVPKLTLDIAVLLSVPALVGLILIIGGQNHQLLTDRNEVLHSSRQRIAEATDRERRRLERDLHDGAQQRLHGALVQISAARRLTATDRAKAESLLRDARSELREAITDLHDLVNGVRPAIVDEFGLAAALRGAVARRTTPVSTAFTRSADTGPTSKQRSGSAASRRWSTPKNMPDRRHTSTCVWTTQAVSCAFRSRTTERGSWYPRPARRPAVFAT